VRGRAETRWWRAEDHHRLTVLQAALDDAYTTSSSRLWSYERAVRLFSEKLEVVIGRNLATPARLDFNLVRTLSLTARAHLAEYAPPRAAIYTEGGSWEMRQRAQDLQKWTTAAVYATKMDKEVREMASVRCAAFGDGPLRIGSRWGKITVESVKPWELFAHEEDERAGELRTLYRVHEEDRGVLAHLYPDEAKAIDETEGWSLVPWGAMGERYGGRSHRIPVVEAWHLPSSPDAEDGLYVQAIEGKILEERPWTAPRFPFAWWGWTRQPGGGFWSSGIADEVGEFQRQIGLLLHKLQAAIDLTTNPRMLAPKASRPTPWPPTNEIGGITWFAGNTPPTWDVARAVSPEIALQIERLWAKGFQQTGIPEMAAMGVKPAGLNSGEAIRVYADKANGRLASWSIGQQDLDVEAAVLKIDEARRLTEEDPEFAVVYQDEKSQTIERVLFADVDLDEDTYTVRAAPVSSLPESPAGKRALVADMLATGQIDPVQARRLNRDPDLDAEQDLLDARVNLLKKNLEDMLFGAGIYIAPEPMDDLVAAKELARAYYAKARSEGVSDARLALVRRWSAAVVALTTPPPPPQPPPGAMPPEGPPADMPLPPPPPDAGAPMPEGMPLA
jgi:hypothetical protein